MNLGQKLRQLRLRKTLSMEELADKLNKLYSKEDGTMPFGKGKISKWEAGKVDPGISSIAKLAKYFNVSLDYLVGNETLKIFQVEEISVYGEYKSISHNEVVDLRYLSSYSIFADDNVFYLESGTITYLINKDIGFKDGNTGLFIVPDIENVFVYKGKKFGENILLTDENGEQNLYKRDEVQLVGVVVSKEIKMI